jgi:hypothetical protein
MTNVDVKYSQFNLNTNEQHEINSRIMEQASDTAEKLTELECELNGVACYVIEVIDGVEHSTYTEDGQDIFNQYYDEQMDELYSLFNCLLSELPTN